MVWYWNRSGKPLANICEHCERLQKIAPNIHIFNSDFPFFPNLRQVYTENLEFEKPHNPMHYVLCCSVRTNRTFAKHSSILNKQMLKCLPSTAPELSDSFCSVVFHWTIDKYFYTIMACYILGYYRPIKLFRFANSII